MSIEAMKLALEALENSKPSDAGGVLGAEEMNDLWHAHYSAKNALRTALSQQPATPEPVGFTYQAEIEYADSTGGNGSFWRVPPDLDDEAVPLYTRPAQSAPDDVVRDAERYRFIRDADVSDDLIPDVALYALESLDEYIDAAMLAAKDASA